MRRLIVLLACIFALLVWALPAVAGPFTDVPTDHWAYDAIDKLQSEGFVEGYPDGTFRGNRSFTRYEMAMVVARIWDRLNSEITTLEAKIQAPGDYVTEEKLQEELKLIYNLLDEFKNDAAGMKARLDDAEKRLGGLETRVSALEANSNTIKFSGALRSRIEDIVTNEYMGKTPPPVFWLGTPGSNPGETFQFEEKIQLAMQAHPSDYLDVYMDMWQIASYLRAPKGMPFPPNQPLVIDEAWAKADMMKLMGWTPTTLFSRFKLTVGRQYARFGEFGLAFDNGFETRPGVAIDVGGDRLGLSAFLARSSRFGSQEGLGVGRASYAFGDSRSTINPRDYFARVGFNYLATGVGDEQGMGGDIDTELLSGTYLNRARVEYFRMQKDQFGFDVKKSLGDSFANNLIAWLDLYNDGNTRVSAAYATIGIVPGFSSIDNDPFTEYDNLFLNVGKNVNMAYESGINPFPSNFKGGGVQVEHTWWDVLNTRLTFYDGQDQYDQNLPVVIRLNVRYPLSEASDIALEYIHSGIKALTLAKLRGEFLVRF